MERASAFAKVAATGLLMALVVVACGPRAPRSAGPRFAGFDAGWTELPPPPEVRDGAALVWTGRELIVWGGCDSARCYPTDDGYAFDPSTRTWNPIPPAPRTGIDPKVVWTGREAVFFYAEGWKLKAVAYDPAADTWRTIPNAPVQPRFGAVHVWTGSEIIVWGGGRPSDDIATTGAAYDPSTKQWRTIADAPVGLNQASGTWTGEEMLVFGSLLDPRNRAETDTSVGAAYDPVTDTWRELPPSQLSPQATSALWLGDRMLAWDYVLKWQLFDPRTARWTGRAQIPLEPHECYPDSEVVDGQIFAFYCGDAAIFEPNAEQWQPVHGGPLDEQIEANGSPYNLWRFADLVAAEDTLFLMAEGITVDQGGTPCYGCDGSPHSFWAYRPD
jgi:Kelch motif